jgi:putative zinc finger protein
MNCSNARRLFDACWDDELTQGERDWLESHLARCPRCRVDYDARARALELVGALPRVDAAPEFVERVLARTRRSEPVADRVPGAAGGWGPLVAAAAAVLVIAGMLLAPWSGISRGPATRPPAVAFEVGPPQPVLRASARVPAPGTAPVARTTATGAVAAVPDSVFDHAEDVELVLDPVTLHHGRASLARSRTRTPVQGEQAVISF